MSKTVPDLPSSNLPNDSLPSSDPFEPQPTPPLEPPARGDLSVTTPPAPVVPAPEVPAPGRSKPSRSIPKIDFANKISVELSGAIENTSWGTTSIALSPDAKWLAAGKMDDKLALFEVATGKPIGEPYPLLQAGQVTAVAFSAQGDHLVAGGYSGKTFAWQVSPDGRLLNEQEFFRFDSEIVTLATSPKFGFFIGASRKGTVAWQPFGLQKSQPRLMQQFQKEVCAVWLPSSGDEAMATDGARWIRFSLRDGEVSESDDLGIKSANLACFSRSGKRLVIADFNTLHLTDLVQRTSRKSIKLPRGDMAYALKFHPQENWVAVGMRGKVALFDFDRAELIAYADAESVFYQTNLEFSSDGRSLAATSDSARDTIKIFRIGQSKLESTTHEEPQP
jgi:WD40 repeat protein